MDNQHRKITGYRELTEAEIALMNAIKQHSVLTELVFENVLAHVKAQRLTPVNPTMVDPEIAMANEARRDDQGRLDAAEPERWAAIARTHLQQGFMALVRAVAQPTSF